MSEEEKKVLIEALKQIEFAKRKILEIIKK